ncbi:MAG: hypothetical protein U9Q06_03195 [Nanoarchaeota archaeon]|nr:hypothetical protein [Nanoarchaeota archaeon]
MDLQNLSILNQYVSSLEDAAVNLEKAYYSRDLEKVKEIKKFILEVKSKVDSLLI